MTTAGYEVLLTVDQGVLYQQNLRAAGVAVVVMIAVSNGNFEAGMGNPSTDQPREWSIHIWDGFDLFAWLRLFHRNRYAVGWRQAYVAAAICCFGLGHTALRWFQQVTHGPRIRRTPIRHDPIFIIGHWRGGTTLLHELLIRDPQFSYADTYHCMVPNHFLLTERLVKHYFHWLLPERRPMDNMAASWESPQEDEFALCMSGQPSPYLTIAFPNHPPVWSEYYDLDRLTPRARSAWERAFVGFLRCLTYRDPRRIVLKSPPHTCRIPTLLRLFPGARFIHLRRDPYELFPSTVNLWKSLYKTHGMQTPNFAGLEEQVLAAFLRFDARYEQTRGLIPAGQLAELRYEELTADPLGRIEQLYGQLKLDGFDRAQPHLAEYLAQQSNYERNRYQYPPEQLATVTRHWGEVIRRWGYPLRT